MTLLLALFIIHDSNRPWYWYLLAICFFAIEQHIQTTNLRALEKRLIDLEKLSEYHFEKLSEYVASTRRRVEVLLNRDQI